MIASLAGAGPPSSTAAGWAAHRHWHGKQQMHMTHNRFREIHSNRRQTLGRCACRNAATLNLEKESFKTGGRLYRDARARILPRLTLIKNAKPMASLRILACRAQTNPLQHKDISTDDSVTGNPATWDHVVPRFGRGPFDKIADPGMSHARTGQLGLKSNCMTPPVQLDFRTLSKTFSSRRSLISPLQGNFPTKTVLPGRRVPARTVSNDLPHLTTIK